MKILLVFPPQCRPLHAAVSLPLIKAELLRQGHECRIVDLNIRFYRHVLSARVLRERGDRMKDRCKRLEQRNELRDEALVSFARMSAALMRLEYCVENIEEALGVFDGDDFYDLGRFQWARKVTEDSLEVFSASFGATDIGLSQLRTCYSVACPDQIMAATDDVNENPFRGLLYGLMAEDIEEFSPDAIGISVMLDEQIIPTFTLARELKEKFGGMLFTGGSMITRWKDRLTGSHPLESVFDRYFFFESEWEFADHLSRIEGRQSLPKRTFTEICPDFDDLSLDQYLLPTKILPFQIARGCSYGRCRYCAHFKTYEKFEQGSAREAVDHLEYLSRRHDVDHFYFIDEELMPKFGETLSSEILARNLDINWMVFGRMQKGWTEDRIALLSKAGCRRLIFGIDGASERIQRIMDKNTDLDHAGHVMAWCADHGVALQLNFICGFPGETDKEARLVQEYIIKNKPALSHLGSTVAVSNFVLVDNAAWDEMALDPVVQDDKPYAIYHGYEVDEGLDMQSAHRLAFELQRGIDKELEASWRFPILREFAFLYCTRARQSEASPRDTRTFPRAPLRTHWSPFDLEQIFGELDLARSELPVTAVEYLSDWSRLSQANLKSQRRMDDLHAYQVTPYFKSNSFELPIVSLLSIGDDANAPA